MGVVIAEDVSEDNSFDFFTLHSVCRYLIQLFFFQRGKEALHTGIIVAMGSTAKALDEPVCYKLPAKGIACILAATVAVKERSVESAVLLTQLFYGVYAEFLFHIITHFKSDDLAVEAVENRRNIEFPVSALNLGDIGQQLFQRLVCAEISFYQILSVLSFSISFCDTVRSSVPVDKPGFAHSAVYRPEAYMSATLCKSCLHPSDTVILVVRML